ncbi:hypothetical protein BGZ60DRAFT_429373 [Tricladium varicosporioides]|nr:hypothetical protein BGZ60DRAFT_429373 [Hymenoscyphus varicosporioides]
MSSRQDITLFGTNAVYEGFWNDRDRGKILGATLTLRDSRAIPLVAALAIIVGLAGGRSWHISRLLWHTWLHVKYDDTNAIKESRRKQQVILRNSETAGGATIRLIEMWFDFGFVRVIRECSPKGIILVLYAIGHWISFIALGVLVSQIVLGKTVVSKTLPTCGQWYPKAVAENPEHTQVYRELTLNLTIDAENYVRSCYPQGGSQGILDCSKFMTRSFSSKTEGKVSCPFEDTACLPDARSAVILESGNITFSQLGFNSKYGKELSVRRRSTCAVLTLLVLLKALLTVMETSPAALADTSNDTRVYSFYKMNSTAEEFPIRGIQNELSNSYKLISFYLPFEPGELHPAFLPKPHNDISLILMQNLGIKYLQPQDDLWFSAHGHFEFNNSTSLISDSPILYRTDHFLNLITCEEQYRFCSSITHQ